MQRLKMRKLTTVLQMRRLLNNESIDEVSIKTARIHTSGSSGTVCFRIFISDGTPSGADAGYGDADEDRIYGLSRCRFRVCR